VGNPLSGNVAVIRADLKRTCGIRSFSLNADAASGVVENASSLSGDELNKVCKHN
jgi:hypothetical protein